MGDLIQDLRYSLRALAKSAAFTSVAVLTLGLGIGSNTAIFSVVKAVLMPPLPFADHGRLVQLKFLNTKTGDESGWLACRDAADLGEQSRAFTRVGIYRYALMDLVEGGRPEVLYGVAVTPELLPALGVKPLLGRIFEPSENTRANHHFMVIGYDFWQRRFHGDPEIVGKTMRLTGHEPADYTIIGVMPAGFNFPLDIPTALTPPTRQMAFWMPFGVDMAGQERDGAFCLAVARMRPGVTVEQAQADVSGIAARIASEFPRTNTGRGVRVVPLAEHALGSARTAMLILLLATGLIVLIACANIANLLLARAATRARDNGIRIAIGAAGSRIIRQSMIESLIIALSGGTLGALLAGAGLRALVRLAPQEIPRLSDTRIDLGVLAATAAVSIVAGLLFGMIPAWRASRADPQCVLREGGRGAGGSTRSRTRDLLIGVEVALAVVLTIGAGLLVKSFARLLAVDAGFRADRVLAGVVVLPTAKYTDAESRIAFFHRLLDSLRSAPGVESTGAVNAVPLSGSVGNAFVQVEGEPAPTSAGVGRPSAEIFSASSDYLATMGISLIQGRYFTLQDAGSGRLLAVINEAAAKRFFPNRSALGRRISVNRDNGVPVWREIAGIVKSTRDYNLDRPARPAIYVPMEQGFSPPMFVVTRVAPGADAGFADRFRQAVQSIDPEQPVYLVTPMQSLVDNTTAQRRFSVVMLTLFGALALVLAAAGVYGLASYSVAQRTREIGIRVALGAGRAGILKLVLRQGLLVTLAGAAAGIAAALVLTRALSTLLYDVRPKDPVIFIAVPLLLIAVELAACYIPARRALKVDPVSALRCE
jgi:putative ABC transport system permease protein